MFFSEEGDTTKTKSLENEIKRIEKKFHQLELQLKSSYIRYDQHILENGRCAKTKNKKFPIKAIPDKHGHVCGCVSRGQIRWNNLLSV
eukprot:2398975-Ditylum_brightwellii.AAC.1